MKKIFIAATIILSIITIQSQEVARLKNDQRGLNNIKWDKYPSLVSQDTDGNNIIHKIIGECGYMTGDENNEVISHIDQKYKNQNGSSSTKNKKNLTVKELARRKWHKHQTYPCAWWAIYLSEMEDQSLAKSEDSPESEAIQIIE